MSNLVLVRHAQASFFEEDYDRLSEGGERQASKLGEYWVSQDLVFDQVFTGPRVRHLRTAEIVGACYRAAGRAWPDIVSVEELDEHQVDRLFIHHTQELSKEFPHLEALAESFATARGEAQRQKGFQRLFEALTELWVSGRCGDRDVESWMDFRSRVNRAVDRIVKQSGHGRKVAVFTSVGAISVALQRALGCSDRMALATGWRVRNCSLTEVVFSGDRFTLDNFNALPHLPREEWTYR